MEKYISVLKNSGNLSPIVREIVFGIEDGMVSTLGSMTGIAVGSQDKYTVLLAGVVIIAVESISMGIGSYVSNKSSSEVTEKIIEDEKKELKSFPDKEDALLYKMFIRDGWSKELAKKMSDFAKKNKSLKLREHQYRELGVFPYNHNKPQQNAIFMFVSYIIGGFIPLVSYFLLPIDRAIYVSVIVTLIGLFSLGATTSVFTKVSFVKSGFRLTVMGGLAFFVGFIVGELASIVR